MTIEEAIEALEFLRILDAPELSEAVHMAINALRAQQEAEKNEPLTLEQLQSMDCHPVFIVEGKNRGWAIVDWHGVNKSWMYFSKTGTAEGMSAKAVFARDYGTDWLAYRRPPGWPGGGYDEGSGST